MFAASVATQAPPIFGPTMRVNRGDNLTITLVNAINMEATLRNSSAPELAQQISNITDGNGFEFPASLNIHTHGIFGSPGQLYQPPIIDGVPIQLIDPANYTGGDNIFIRLKGFAPPEPMKSMVYVNPIPESMSPGMYWIHPHLPGSTSLSTSTAYSIFIVNDDPAFLPESTGCGPIWEYLSTVNETILSLTTTDFSIPPGIVGTPYENMTMSELLALTANTTDVLNAFLDFPNQQFIDIASDPTTTLCCNATKTKYPFRSSQNDFALVNGAFTPRIRFAAGGWQRWRLLNAAMSDYFEVSIVTSDNNQAPAPCQFYLYAKDGLYMMRIPRIVPALYMYPAARAEVLVQCEGKPGDTYILATGYGPGYTGENGACTPENPNCVFFKSYLATIEITAPVDQKLPPLAVEACIPLRSDYAADLRDPALEQQGLDLSTIDNKLFSMTDLDAFGCNIGNKWFSFPIANPYVLKLGTITELEVQYANHHAFHIHVQPFQLQKLPKSILANDSYFSSYFQAGDWHDTIYMPMVAQGQNVTVRLNPGGGVFSGYSVAHCHLLPHEDEGCMVVTKLECPGHEGNEQPLSCDVGSPVKGTMSTGGGGGNGPAPGPSLGPSPGRGPSPAPPASNTLSTAPSLLTRAFIIFITATAVAAAA